MRLTVLIAIFMMLVSCNRRQVRPVVLPPLPPVAAPPVAPPPPAAAAPPVEVPAAPPPLIAPPAPAPSITAIENAGQEFARANYSRAAEQYQQYLNLVASGGRRDEALFHLGLIYSLSASQPGDPRQDWQRAANYFNQVVTEFPRSPLKPAAQVILALRNETVQLATESETRNQRIKQLNAELERLIRIDSERRPR